MISRQIRIHDWEIMFLFSFGPDDIKEVLASLRWAEAPSRITEGVKENVREGRLNEGFTYSNPWLRRTVFGIGETSSGPEVLDSTVHEIIHITQHISLEDEIDPYGEEIAYLGGHISQSISDIVCELSCPHCNH